MPRLISSMSLLGTSVAKFNVRGGVCPDNAAGFEGPTIQGKEKAHNMACANAFPAALVNRVLRRAGWRVLRVWEHELTKRNEARFAIRLRRWFASGEAAES